MKLLLRQLNLHPLSGQQIKRLRLSILVVCWLFCASGVGSSQEFILQPHQKYFSPEIVARLTKELPWEKTLAMDLESIITCYPGFIRGVELSQDKLYLILKNGEQVIYDDGLSKGFRERLDKPDMKDMLAQIYLQGGIRQPFNLNDDPGRFRVKSFFDAVYGGSAAAVRAKLVMVNFCGVRVFFNSQNGAAQALEAVGQDLTLLREQCPQLSHYLLPLGGTFNWRIIAGTARISPHSWGIAIDPNPRCGAYWRGYKRAGLPVGGLCENYPQEVVELFEKHGFIWGGKWSHFDLMHFEYRPELLLKCRMIHLEKP